MNKTRIKTRSIAEVYEKIIPEERIILDVLRSVIREEFGSYCKEKISYNVPFYTGKKGMCIIWPSSIPRGGLKSGVLLGFWNGNHLPSAEKYLTRGTNKKILYIIYQSVDEIDILVVRTLLQEALNYDLSFSR